MNEVRPLWLLMLPDHDAMLPTQVISFSGSVVNSFFPLHMMSQARLHIRTCTLLDALHMRSGKCVLAVFIVILLGGILECVCTAYFLGSPEVRRILRNFVWLTLIVNNMLMWRIYNGKKEDRDHDHADEMMMADGRYFCIVHVCVFSVRTPFSGQAPVGGFLFVLMFGLFVVCFISFSKRF